MASREQTIAISCLEVWRQISAYVDDDLSPELRARLENHFKGCHHCLAVMSGTRNVVRLVGDDRAFDLPEGFSERLVARLADRFRMNI